MNNFEEIKSLNHIFSHSLQPKNESIIQRIEASTQTPTNIWQKFWLARNDIAIIISILSGLFVIIAAIVSIVLQIKNHAKTQKQYNQNNHDCYELESLY
jgi:hypothetical protein